MKTIRLTEEKYSIITIIKGKIYSDIYIKIKCIDNKKVIIKFTHQVKILMHH